MFDPVYAELWVDTVEGFVAPSLYVAHHPSTSTLSRDLDIAVRTVYPSVASHTRRREWGEQETRERFRKESEGESLPPDDLQSVADNERSKSIFEGVLRGDVRKLRVGCFGRYAGIIV